MKTASRIKLAASVASVVRASLRPGGPNVVERVHAVPRLLRATLDGTYAGTTMGRLGLVAAAVAYVASPIDLLPEAFLPVVGAADDAVVIGWAVKAFVEETDRFVAWELAQGLRRNDTVRGEATWTAPTAGRPGTASATDAPRPDRDTTGAAAPGAGSQAPEGKVVLPEGVRQAATDYVLETMRKRLER
jgi:uncharacterized membrane protein YkvA (DUF1232 family)